ncbi:MAG: KilA-N domain-containing protein [Methanobrevibacter sp.]|nr:KilA-N domain-containing protein [Methanobrevibacter sp.]
MYSNQYMGTYIHSKLVNAFARCVSAK